MKSIRDYLKDMLIELADVAEFTADGREAFLANRMAQKAVIRCYEIIGEIVKRLPNDFRLNTPQIAWRKLAGFRDFLAHNYDEIQVENVWMAVKDLIKLRSQIQELVDDPNLDVTDEPEDLI